MAKSYLELSMAKHSNYKLQNSSECYLNIYLFAVLNIASNSVYYLLADFKEH